MRQTKRVQVGIFRSPVTHRVVIAHTADTLEAWDFCRGVASYRPRSGIWGLRSVPMKSHSSPTYLERLAQTECDGFIMVPGRRRTLETLHLRGVKVVDVDGDGDRPQYPQIGLDNHHIGRLAGEHLVDRGFTRIVFLGDGSAWSRLRASGLKEVIASAGGQFICLTDGWNRLLSPSWIASRIGGMLRPFAVMGCDDNVAACAVRAINKLGWEIPAEVGVVGVDDRITQCIGVQPPLTSISIERFRIGHEAARLVDQLMLGKSDKRQIRLLGPDRVIERESTSTYACEDPDIGAAVAFIHREACNGVTIDHVARAVNLSRRTLERRFLQLVGRPPGEEIRRVRLDMVKRMIERTHLSLGDIAAQCGFASISSLSHSFRLSADMSPQVYRAKVRSAEWEPR